MKLTVLPNAPRNVTCVIMGRLVSRGGREWQRGSFMMARSIDMGRYAPYNEETIIHS
jgi:hypothetical protein